jgi:hypothetical protein
MLKVYTVQSYVSINGKEWQHVGVDGHTARDDDSTEKIFFENFTFEQCYEYLQEKSLDGIWFNQTFFRKKPMIHIGKGFCGVTSTYKYFDTISYKYVYKEWETVSLDWIMKHLSADQCIQYLKERGMTACPILK